MTSQNKDMSAKLKAYAHQIISNPVFDVLEEHLHQEVYWRWRTAETIQERENCWQQGQATAFIMQILRTLAHEHETERSE